MEAVLVIMVKVVLIEGVSFIEKKPSLRLSLPRKVAEGIKVSGGDIVGFYSDDERIWIERMK